VPCRLTQSCTRGTPALVGLLQPLAQIDGHVQRALSGGCPTPSALSCALSHLAGHPPLRTPWPTDDPGLTRAERRHLQQQLLLANGYHIGEPDGKIGPVTRADIADAERRSGMPPTGRAGQKIYRALGAGEGPGVPRAPSCHLSRIQREAAG
jgi:hypothetical protein